MHFCAQKSRKLSFLLRKYKMIQDCKSFQKKFLSIFYFPLQFLYDIKFIFIFIQKGSFMTEQEEVHLFFKMLQKTKNISH